MFVKFVILACSLLVLVSYASVYAAETGFLKGHLKIIRSQEVQLDDQMQSQPDATDYADYPLIILSKDTKKEVARVVADSNGDYRIALSPGDYILDAKGRLHGHLRAKPEPFTVVSNQTVRVDMTIDTGVR
jgi:hypothetical protein